MKYTGTAYDVAHIQSLKGMILHSAREYALRPAFKIKEESGEYRSVSYLYFKREIEALGTALYSLNLKGEKIAVISENRYEWCLTYLAAVCGGCVIVPIDKELPKEDIVNILNVSGAKAVFYSEKYQKNIHESEELCSGELIKIHFDTTEDGGQELSFNKLLGLGYSLLEKGEPDYINAEIDEKKMTALLFTSGTTGFAKGVMLSNENICSNIMSIAKMVKVNQDDQMLSILPLHHTYECTIGFLLPLYSGACIAFCEGIRHIAKNIKEVRPTALVLVPLIIESIHTKIIAKAQEKKTGSAKLIAAKGFSNALLKVGVDTRKKIFSQIFETFGGRLRLIITGAAPIKPNVMKDFHDFGFTILQGYGLTECSPLVAGNNDHLITQDTVGRAIPDVEIDIINKDANGIGEIICKGPNVMLGYYQNSEETEKVLHDGWFHTGDLGMFDSSGCLKITGRIKNVIVTKNGKNIYPEEVEFHLQNNPFVAEALVFGEEDEDETVVKARVFPNIEAIKKKFNLSNISAEQIKNAIGDVIKDINAKLPSYKNIKRFDIKESEFVKTTTQKIKRYIHHENTKKE